MALVCCRFPKKERKKERKWVFFGADMPIDLKARSIIQWSNFGCRVVLGFLFLFFFDSSGYGQEGGKKKIGSILWYENFYNFFYKELEILVSNLY
jgi:hypothetical protein